MTNVFILLFLDLSFVSILVISRTRMQSSNLQKALNLLISGFIPQFIEDKLIIIIRDFKFHHTGDFAFLIVLSFN
jgi:hypothetical protein